MHVQPDDHWRCRSCTQLLTFGPDSRVPLPQLAACQAKCSWVLVERSGRPVHPDPFPDGPIRG